MQTFLPYPDLQKSLACLDYRRLGKQRVEAAQLLRSMGYVNSRVPEWKESGSRINKGWINHPARAMWVGYESALALYHDMAILAWKSRGYNNTMPYLSTAGKHLLPPWFGDEAFHASHRSNLLRKDPLWYGKFGWTETPELEYVWPSKITA